MFDRVDWRRRLWIIGLAVAIVWYPTLTWLLGFTPRTKLDFGLAFNSMAEHLLAGRFDVDPRQCDDWCQYRTVCRYYKPEPGA